MMRLFLNGVLLNIFFATVAAAQTVTVRSGEHSDFTRIVLTLPDRAEWSLNQSGATAILNLEDGPYAFDTSSVFQRISGKRLSSAQPTGNGNGLILGLACPCEVSGFWHTENMLVLDIKDMDESFAGLRPVARRNASNGSAAGQETRFRSEPRSAAAGLMMSSLPVLPEEPRERLTLDRKADDASKIDPQQETRDQLLKQFGRAASQGLLTPRSHHDPTDHSDDKPVSRVQSHTENVAPNPAELQSDLSQINLHAQTSMDEAFLKGSLPRIALTHERACLPNELVNVQAWSTGSPFWSQVGALRSGMTTPTGKLNDDVLRDLARLYIHYGFGAEAIQTLEMASSLDVDDRVLQAMANLLEHGASDAPNILQDQLHCAPDVLLWSLLATATWPQQTQIDTDAALLAFSALPHHLRQYLGPDLSRRFRAARRDEIADQILRATSRDPQAGSPAFLVERAISDADKGSRDMAIKSLEDVVETGAEPSAKALVKLVEYKLEANEPISFEMAQLAGAYAKENNNLPIADELQWAQIIALASSGAFDTAFGLLEDFEEDLSKKRPNLQSDVLGLLVENSDDVQFLRHALTFGSSDTPPTTALVGNGLAGRLLDLGFPEEASKFTADTVPQSLRRDRAVLNARIALALVQPRKAEVELLGLEGEDVNLLRARARSMAGEHAAAGDLYASAQEPQAALREKWLAEDWQGLGASENSAVSKLASVLSAKDEEPADITENTAELWKNRQLLEDSTTIRESIQGLLQTTPTPGSDLN